MMQKKFYSLLFVAILLVNFNQQVMSQSNLMLKLKNAGDISFSVADISKITFSSGNMLITSKQQSSQSFALQDVSKIYFDLGSGVSNPGSTNLSKLLVFPNPASVQLTVQGIQNGVMTIYSATGTMVLQSESGNDELVLDISSLAKGLYFVKSGSKTTKFIKL